MNPVFTTYPHDIHTIDTTARLSAATIHGHGAGGAFLSAPMRSPAEYDLLLDAAVPLEGPRANTRDWDDRKWGELLRAADWHRLSAILFCHLDGRREVPAAVHSALERTYMGSAARSLFIASELRRVGERLARDHIPAMLLKGAALVETVYEDRAQREMLDLDLLVGEGQLAYAEASLVQLGYRSSAATDDSAFTPRRLSATEHHGPALVGAERLVAVELHRHISISGEGRRFDIEDLWHRARPTADGPWLLPAPEDLMLHVCLHFTRNRLGGSHDRLHTGGALGQIADIARLARAGGLDWGLLASSARHYGLATRVFMALFAARELGVAIPFDALSKLEPAGFDSALGRRLVELRVLRADDHLPVRSLRWMLAPSREVLSRGWNADPTATLSLARAYLARARARAPLARSTLKRPWQFVQDRRLNGQIFALEDRR